MAAIVCHGLQPCLESQLVESRALTLSFPFPSSSSSKPPQNPITFWDSSNTNKTPERKNKTDTNTGFSFLQALSNVSYVSKESSTEKETVYVHPQAKRCSSTMSQKSLELCTEKLGNETGSDIVENNNGYEEMDLLCSWPTREQNQATPREGSLGRIRRMTKREDFPPPLTTLRGSESMRIRSHREDGRLVVEAMRVPPSVSCFQAERSNGRLRLWFLKNGDNKFDPEEKEEEEEIDDDSEGVEEECESDGEEDSERRKQVEETEEEEEEGEEMRRKEYERPRGCKEGRQHENNDFLNNWGEPLFVPIS